MANLLLLAVSLPGVAPAHIGGFILADDDETACEVAFRRDWAHIRDADADLLAGYDSLLKAMASEVNVRAFIDRIESTLSNTIRCLDRARVHSPLPLADHAALLRRGLLGEA